MSEQKKYQDRLCMSRRGLPLKAAGATPHVRKSWSAAAGAAHVSRNAHMRTGPAGTCPAGPVQEPDSAC